MVVHFKLICTAILVGAVVDNETAAQEPTPTPNPEHDGLHHFVTDAMSRFKDWVVDNNLDPTPPNEDVGKVDFVVDNPIVRFEGHASNISVAGFSAQTNFNVFSSMLIGGQINMYYYIPDGSVTGSYKGNGSALDLYPMLGEGQFKMESTGLGFRFGESFTVQGGFIKLTHCGQCSEAWLFNYNNYVTEFKNLFTPEIEPYKDQILRLFTEEMLSSFVGKRIVYRHIFNYLDSILSTSTEMNPFLPDKVTPVSEIIGFLPPITTSTTNSTQQTTSTTAMTVTTSTTVPTVTTSTTTTTPPPVTSPTYSTTTPRPCSEKISESGAEGVNSEGLNNFLRNAIDNYGQWLDDNQLDPSPPIVSPAPYHMNSSFLKIDGLFRNIRAGGISTASLYDVFSNFITPEFRIRVEFSDVRLFGQFNASGSIMSKYPIDGEGDWEIRFFNAGLEIAIYGFAIADGYINIRQYENREISMWASDAEIFIPDLISPGDADGLGQEVLDALKTTIPEALKEQDKHAIIKSLLDYLDFQFSRTPVTEIIGTTRPPCFL